MNILDILIFINTVLPIISWFLLGIVLIQIGRLIFEIIKNIRFRIRIEKYRPTAKNIFEALGLTPWKIITARRLGVLFFTLSLAVVLFGYINQHSGFYQSSPIVADFYVGISTNFASIAITILIIDYLAEKRSDEQLKAQLIREMATSDNGIALRAINEIRGHGWLEDGSLRGKTFDGVNWKGANLIDADLQGVTFLNANISHANFSHADLRKSCFVDIDISGSNLHDTNLVGINSVDEKFFSLAELAFINSDKMIGATMPNGKRYDGRYNLKGDLYIAKEWNVRNLDVETDEGMAKFYKVSLDEYLEGQKWAKENLPKLFEMRDKSKLKKLQPMSNVLMQKASPNTNNGITVLGILGMAYGIGIVCAWFLSRHKKT